MKYPSFFILLALFLLQFLFVSPMGEFALNDDWVHTDAVRHLSENGQWKIMPFAGATFHALTVYGAAWTRAFGFSFSILRISVLVLMFLIVYLWYRFTKKETGSLFLGIFAALALWLNPIVYNLSFTFMTDVPALLLLIIGILLYTKAFDEKSVKHLLWGHLIGVLGFFVRQTNILLLGGTVLAAFFLKRFSLREQFKSLILPTLFLAGTYALLATQNLLPHATNSHYIEGIDRWFGHVRWWTWYIPLYLGLFLSPITFSWFPKHLSALKDRRFIALLSFFVLTALAIRQSYGLQLPYVLNMISVYGLGSIREVLNGQMLPLFTSRTWAIVTLLSAASAAISIYMMTLKKPDRRFSFLWYFAGLFILVLLAFESFDRYIMMLIPVGTVALLQNRTKKEFSLLTFGVIIAIMGYYSISQTQFYMNWNHARWELANELAEQAKPQQIDAGYEWNGWNDYWRAHQEGPEQGPETAPWYIRLLFTDNSQDYIVATSPIPPYETVKSVEIDGANPNNQLFVLKKPAVYTKTHDD